MNVRPENHVFKKDVSFAIACSVSIRLIVHESVLRDASNEIDQAADVWVHAILN